jgi:Big-like domain-containing protein
MTRLRHCSRATTMALSGSLLLAAAVSVTAAAQTPVIERLRITPAARTIAVGDSLQLNVQALDGRGTAVSGAIVRFNAQGGRFQGAVDSLGWVRAGSPGTVPIAVTAIVPGGRPIVEKVEVRITPGPAARIVVGPAVSKMLVGQRLRLGATVLSAAGDARDDAVTWASSSAAVVRVADGVLTALSPGTATITARASNATSAVAVQVISSTGVTASINPNRANARQGDVVRFAVTVKGSRGQTITGLTPSCPRRVVP